MALAVIVRPTALIVWFPLLLFHFKQEEDKLRLITHDVIPIGSELYTSFRSVSLRLYSKQKLTSFFLSLSLRSLALLVSTAIDCTFYEKVTCSVSVIGLDLDSREKL